MRTKTVRGLFAQYLKGLFIKRLVGLGGMNICPIQPNPSGPKKGRGGSFSGYGSMAG